MSDADEGPDLPPLCSTCQWRHFPGSRCMTARPRGGSAERIGELVAGEKLADFERRLQEARATSPERRQLVGPPCPTCGELRTQVTNCFGTTWIEPHHHQPVPDNPAAVELAPVRRSWMDDR